MGDVHTRRVFRMNGSQAPSSVVHFFLSFSLLPFYFYLIFFLTISLNFLNYLLYLHKYMPIEMITAPIGRKTHHCAIFFKSCVKNNPLLNSDSQDSVICMYNLIL